MNMLIVLQKMLYQKHNLHILNYHVQMFLLRSSITRDAQIEKMKLLSIAFE